MTTSRQEGDNLKQPVVGITRRAWLARKYDLEPGIYLTASLSLSFL